MCFGFLKAAEIRGEILDVGIRQIHGEHLHHVIAARTIPVRLDRQGQVLFLLPLQVRVDGLDGNAIRAVTGNTGR